MGKKYVLNRKLCQKFHLIKCEYSLLGSFAGIHFRQTSKFRLEYLKGQTHENERYGWCIWVFKGTVSREWDMWEMYVFEYLKEQSRENELCGRCVWVFKGTVSQLWAKLYTVQHNILFLFFFLWLSNGQVSKSCSRGEVWAAGRSAGARNVTFQGITYYTVYSTVFSVLQCTPAPSADRYSNSTYS